MGTRSILFLLLGVLALGAQAPEARPLRVGLFHLKPHLFWEDDRAQGAAVDYLNAIAEKTGHRLVWASYPFPRLQALLYQGELDCSLMMSKNPEREKHLVFPSRVQFHVRPIFVVKKDSPLAAIPDGHALKGLTIGYLEGANLSPFMRRYEANYQLERLGPVGYVQQNFQKLLAGRIQAIYDLNHITYPYEAVRLGHADQIRILSTPDDPVHVYVVASRRSEAGRAFLKAYSAYARTHHVAYETFLAPYLPPGIPLE